MDKKKAFCLLSLVLMLLTMSCSCNLFQLILGEKEELGETLLQEAEQLQDLGEEIVEDMDIDELGDVVEDTVGELTEEDDGPQPLGQNLDEAEEIAEDVVEDVLPGLMGTQPNWELTAMGCDEFYQKGNEYIFHDQGQWAVLELGGEDYAMIIDMAGNWNTTNFLVFDAENPDETTPGFWVTFLTINIDTFYYEVDNASMFWDFEDDQQHIYGTLEFNAHKFDTASGENLTDCTIFGQIAFDNIPIE